MSHAQLAALQMNSGDDVEANLAAAAEQLHSAADRGAGIAVLPENFAFMSADEDARSAIAEADGEGPIQDFLAAQARALGLWIVGGTIPIRSTEPGRSYAACGVWDDHGQRVGRYDKVHLFDVQVPGSSEAYRESTRTMPGEGLLTVETPFGRLGVAICYDLRFPELFRALLAEDVRILALPSAFTTRTGAAHWHILLRARAIENLAYVIAAAQGGEHPGGRRTYGHSLIVGPWGEVLAEAGTRPEVLTASMDVTYLEHLRQGFPVLQHRRLPQATVLA